MRLHHWWRISLYTGTLIACLLLAGAASAQEANQNALDQPIAAEAARRSTSALLPDITRFWLSVEDLDQLEANLSNTQIGNLAQQDTLAPFFSSFADQIREAFNNNGIKLGIDVAAVENMLTGEVAFASILPDLSLIHI